MGVASEDEPTEHDDMYWDTHHDVRHQPAAEVVLAELLDMFITSPFLLLDHVFMSNLEKEEKKSGNIKSIDREDDEIQQVDVGESLPHPDQSPAYQSSQTWCYGAQPVRGTECNLHLEIQA